MSLLTSHLPASARPTLTTDVDELLDLAGRLHGRPIPCVRMTERQFIDWRPEDVRAEWVDGEIEIMTSPNGEHADLNGWLYRLLSEFVDYHDLGLVRLPFNVRLPEQGRLREPDIFFVQKSRMSNLSNQAMTGAPDLVVEIVSPDSTTRDWKTKYLEYESAGVREYWVVDPLTREFGAFTLSRRRLKLIMPRAGRIESKALAGLHIDPQWLWQSPLPPIRGVLKQLGLR